MAALRLRVGVAEQHPHAVCRIIHLHVLIGDVPGAQRSAKVLLPVIEQLFHGTRDVHLVHEVHAAAQVETELQRAQAEPAHPVRNAGGLGECDRELAGTRFGDHVACLELVLLAGEAQRQTPLLQEHAGRLDALRPEQLLDAGAVGILNGGAIARQLQGILLAEHVGHGQQDADQEHDRDQHDLPARVGDHALLTVPFGSSWVT
jgi:hypothetical protein